MNKQQMVDAAVETLAAARPHMENCSSDTPELDWVHLEEMAATMRRNLGMWSDGKIGRWLGWLQAACVASTMGGVTLETCKQINRKHTDD